ncbi:sensor histidine kinase KdpD [Phyllobacterium sp. 0TCS1.6C]|uniref:sensor histidine kinase n=1 Tax=unclassified Phyllobacterium TaxID=2638441 RepID=UPI0022656301|nr:sensor histidine kinase KdpD [Phyllobacterium sp. 0TCS1.6C]MCX8278688.1 sensor histidine kinase KdpD [Phyllobacterium sp. 0TCS1.6C]
MPEQSHQMDRRPKPDALLQNAGSEGRGRLKIFLGAAPGVGKTYEMLTEGKSALAEGRDVVIGVVETHGRKETAQLLSGFEIVGRAPIIYKGHRFEEMDLDGIIARRPSLVLVDELAHTNAPGSRHPKRYLDVEELLARGIDVYSTVNIQHVESLGDVVEQITGVRVRETVPDTIIDRADEVEVVDLTPADLIKRLHEGKVYVPSNAKRAIDNYFSPGNLTALRELALRRTAQRVDEQLLTHMQANAISGPWAAGDRVLICVDEHASSASLVRYGRRFADRLRAPWVAVHVDMEGFRAPSEGSVDTIASCLRLAEQLGGEAVTLLGKNAAEEIARYARDNNVTHIVAGKSEKPRWREFLMGSVSHDLVRVAGDISVHLISANDADHAARPATAAAAPLNASMKLSSYALAAGTALGALLFGLLLSRILDVRNIALVFLMAVFTTAVLAGLWPALFASVLGALLFNFFFLQPLYTLDIGDPESVIALGFFFGVAVIASNLAARVQRQAAAARQRARTTEDLYQFSRKLAGTGVLDDVLWATAFQIASMLKLRVVLLLPEDGTIAVRAGYPPDDTLDDADIAAARWAWEHDRPAGRGADTLPGAKRLYIPLRTGRGAVGVIGLDGDRNGPLLTPDQQRLLDALADQAAVAIERTELAAEADRAKLAAESDRLRSALLTSISHDLKTPLAAVLGAAGTLKDFDGDLSREAKAELITTVIDESERLNRFIANLLDMTRIESGAMRPNLALHYPGDVIGSTLNRARKITSRHELEVVLPQDLPMVNIDPVLLEQVLFNLLDNAAKYSPAGTTIRIQASEDREHVTLQILDEGKGIPQADLERVFDMFYRVDKGDRVTAGTGLGLAIARGFIEAMNGTIAATRRPGGRGTVFTIKLPVSPDWNEVEHVS